MRLTKAYGRQLLTGLLNLMRNEGIIETPTEFKVREPFSSEIGEVYYINAPAAGLFVPLLDHCEMIEKGQWIGDIVDPQSGTVREPIYAPSGGILFTLREYPVVYEGSLLARIFGESDAKDS